jgi:selenophosphate synthase
MLDNRQTAEIMLNHQSSACSDITGFGLIGHLLECYTPAKSSLNFTLTNCQPWPMQLNALTEVIDFNYKANSEIYVFIRAFSQ